MKSESFPPKKAMQLTAFKAKKGSKDIINIVLQLLQWFNFYFMKRREYLWGS